MVLACIKYPRLQTEPQEFVQSRANVGLALRLKQIMKGAHLRPVITALGYLDCRAPAELAVPGVTVPQGIEDRSDTARIVQASRLTLMGPRDHRTRWNIRKADAALLQPVCCHWAGQYI